MFKTATLRTLALAFVTASAPAFSAGNATAEGAAADTQVAAADVPQYVVQDGKVDQATFNGYRRFHGTCHACHGQDAMGGSFAPSLVDSLQALSYDEFKTVVLQGRQAQSAAGGVSAMPAFANDKNITKHLDDIYRYLAARADGELGTGRPERLPRKK